MPSSRGHAASRARGRPLTEAYRQGEEKPLRRRAGDSPLYGHKQDLFLGSRRSEIKKPALSGRTGYPGDGFTSCPRCCEYARISLLCQGKTAERVVPPPICEVISPTGVRGKRTYSPLPSRKPFKPPPQRNVGTEPPYLAAVAPRFRGGGSSPFGRYAPPS
jgi:hypothetical protein